MTSQAFIMKDGVCPKCGSTEILVLPGSVWKNPWGQLLYAGPFSPRVPLSRRVCLSCGFCEEWIDQPGDLERLRKYYTREKRKRQAET